MAARRTKASNRGARRIENRGFSKFNTHKIRATWIAMDAVETYNMQHDQRRRNYKKIQNTSKKLLLGIDADREGKLTTLVAGGGMVPMLKTFAR